MKIISKNDSNFPKGNYVIVDKKLYSPDYVINFEKGIDNINLKDCTCVFAIINRDNPTFIKFVGAKTYEELTSENIVEKINGYLPDIVLCFTKTNFPLDKFLEENPFDIFTA
ncbi:hypothetical protein [Yeosuana sp.]|uniref:hypothetical protein n=1 Tax=Yeosuana sp. TaxID=2529388 RepID=UPI00404B164B